MRFHTKSLILTILGLFGIIAGWTLVESRKSRLIFHGHSQDRTEFVIYQLAVPQEFGFDTRFLFRRNGEPWRSHYYNHEDPYRWTGLDVVFNDQQKEITIYRDGNLEIRFNWQSDVFERRSPSGAYVESVGSGVLHAKQVKWLLGNELTGQ